MAQVLLLILGDAAREHGEATEAAREPEFVKTPKARRASEFVTGARRAPGKLVNRVTPEPS